MTFEEWWEKGQYEKMGYNDIWARIVWNAAIEAALAAWNEVDADDIVCLKSS